MNTTVERARWRFTASYKVLRTLQLGVEFNAAVDEFNPLVTWFVVTETERRPALFLGTSSDRIGSPVGTQAYYATASKYVPGLRTSAYVSLNYSEWSEGFNYPFGAALEIAGGVSARYMYDGEHSHALLDYDWSNIGVSLMWVWLEDFGVAFYGGF